MLPKPAPASAPQPATGRGRTDVGRYCKPHRSAYSSVNLRRYHSDWTLRVASAWAIERAQQGEKDADLKWRQSKHSVPSTQYLLVLSP
jgi:hypothetical protein